LAILANIGMAFKSAVSGCRHFQRLAGVENGGTSVCRGKPEKINVSPGLLTFA